MAPCRLAGICRLLLLILYLTVVFKAEAKAGQNAILRRQKREWIIPPAKLTENVDYTKREFIAKVRSDKASKYHVKYSLTGIGADQPPLNLFVVNRETGFVTVTGILDREEYHQFNLTAYARFPDGSLAESQIDLKVVVLDQNDNPPVFQPLSASVRECSQVGTYVATMTATDADEAGSDNSKIVYSILSQEPAGSESVFAINERTGAITIKRPILDREVHDSYTVVVQGVDGVGAPGANTGTGTVSIEVRDINDNVPTLEKDMYSGNIDEGAEDLVVMRLKALDADLVDTDNWLAVFHIVSGNEEGLFTIETDPKTNEGILRLVEPVDYEKTKEIDLDILIENVAPFVNGSAVALGYETDLAGPGISPSGGIKPSKPGQRPGKTPGKSYPIKIAVNNMPDGPGFQPKVKQISVSEDPEKVTIPMVIASYPATDGDTGEVVENVRYAKGHDPDNWFSIDEKTAEIRLNKVPDRESPFVVNGTYKALILCMTEDVPSKTVTGTIALTVEDSNDHCPMLTSTYQSACTNTKVVNISAFDADDDANPLFFRLIEEDSRGEWEMKPIDDTSASFWAKEPLWPGMYHITVEVIDAQGTTCPDRQKMELLVCTCEEGGEGGCGLKAAQQTSSSFNVGMSAIGLMILGLALLLLVPLLLLVCQCGAAAAHFTEMPFDAKEYLIPYHIESIGEDKEVPLLSSPVSLAEAGRAVSAVNIANVATKFSMGVLGKSSGSFYGEAGGTFGQEMMGGMQETDYQYGFHQNSFSSGRRQEFYTSHTNVTQDIFEGIALPDDILHEYYFQKAMYESQNCKVNDCLLVYDYEGQESPAGSLGCCSLLGVDDDLAFLEDLGPKFTTLAQICKPPKPTVGQAASLQSEVKRESSISARTVKVTQAPPPLPPVQPTVTETRRTISSSATLPRMLVRETVPAQTVLVQQQQPLYYLVEPQVQHRVVLAERPPVGLSQGLLLVNSGPVLQGVIPGQTATTTSPTLLLQGGQTLVQNSTLPRAMIAGSQRVVAVTQGQTSSPSPQQVHTLGRERVVLHDRQVDQRTDAPGSVRTLWPTSQIQSTTFSSPTVPTYESGLLSSEQVNMVQSNITQVPQLQQSLFTTGFLEGVGRGSLTTAEHSMSSFSSKGVEETISVAAVPQVPPIVTVSTQLEAELEKRELSVPAVEDLAKDTTQQDEVSVEIQGNALAEEHVEVEIEADKTQFHLEIDSSEKATEAEATEVRDAESLEASEDQSVIHEEAQARMDETSQDSSAVVMQTESTASVEEMSLSEDVSDDVVEPDMEAIEKHEETLTVSSQVLDAAALLDISVTEDPSLTGTIIGNTDTGWTVNEYASDTVDSAPEISPEDTDIIDLVAGQMTAGHSLQSESETVQDIITVSVSEMEVSATQDIHAMETEDEVSNVSLRSKEISYEQTEQGATGQVFLMAAIGEDVAMEGDGVILNQEMTTVSEMDDIKAEESLEPTAVEMQEADPDPVEEECEVEEIEYTGQIPEGQTTGQNEQDPQTQDASTTELPETDEPVQAEDELSHHEQDASTDEPVQAEDELSHHEQDASTDEPVEAEDELPRNDQLLEEVEVGSTLNAETSEKALIESEKAQAPMDETSQDSSAVVMQTESTASVEEKSEVEGMWEETGQMPEGQTFGQDIEEHQDLQMEDDSNAHLPEETLQEEEKPPHHDQTLDLEMPTIAEQDAQDESLDACEDQSEIQEEPQQPDEEDMSDAGSMSVQCSTAYSEQTDDLSDSEVAGADKMSDGCGDEALDAEVPPVQPEEAQPCEYEDMILPTNAAQPTAFVESAMSMQTVPTTMIVEREADSVVEESPEHLVPDVAVVQDPGISLAVEEELGEAACGIDEVTEAETNLGVVIAAQPDSQPGSEGEEEVQTETESVVAAGEPEVASAESVNANAEVEREQVDSMVTTAASKEAEEPLGLETPVEEAELESEASVEEPEATPQSISVESGERRAEPQPRRVEMATEEPGVTLEVLQALEMTGDLDLQPETVEASGTNLSTEVEEILQSVASSQETKTESPTAATTEEVEDGQGWQVAQPQGQELGATAAVSSSSMSKKQKKSSKRASKGPKSPKSPVGKCKQQ